MPMLIGLILSFVPGAFLAGYHYGRYRMAMDLIDHLEGQQARIDAEVSLRDRYGA